MTDFTQRKQALEQRHLEAQRMVINLEQALQNWRVELIKLAAQIDQLQMFINEQHAESDGEKAIVPKGFEVKR